MAAFDLRESWTLGSYEESICIALHHMAVPKSEHSAFGMDDTHRCGLARHLCFKHSHA